MCRNRTHPAPHRGHIGFEDQGTHQRPFTPIGVYVGYTINVTLPTPAYYQPWMTGRFSMAPGLRPLGTDFGNGSVDAHAFHFDSDFQRSCLNKQRALIERPGKYVCTLAHHSVRKGMSLIAQRLCADHPAIFNPQGPLLSSSLTGGTVNLDDDQAFTKLGLQIAEDVAIISLQDPDQIVALHLCAPSRWGAEAKIGTSFAVSHGPVPDFDAVRPVGHRLLRECVDRGPFIRFVWTIESDDRLNHHPEPPPGADPIEWRGRQFDQPLFVRTERQVLFGQGDVLIFVIGVQAQPVEKLTRPQRESLAAGLLSMSDAAQRYKGVAGHVPQLVKRLTGP